jgi:hypothetical protein
MKRSFLLAVAVGIAFGQPLFVSSVFGDRVKLYEHDQRGSLTFTLENSMGVPLTFFAIETWGFETRGDGPLCSIREGAYLATGSKQVIAGKCALPFDWKTGQPVSHASRIVEVGLANGWKWGPRMVPVRWQK